MNFDFSDEQKLLQQTARDFLTDNATLSNTRAVLEADSGYDRDLWKGIAELGWLGVAIPESYGGAGYGYLELAMIAGEIGRALAPIPFGPTIYLAAETIARAGSDDQKQRILTAIAAGDSIGSFATTECPGSLSKKGIEATFADGKLNGTKLPVSDGDIADFCIVLAREGDGLSLVLVDLTSAGVERTRLESLDPSRPQSRIVFRDTPAERLGKRGEGWSLTQDVLNRAAVLMAFEQIGGADRAFEITFDFMMNRFAFGRPIASFQAIKHRLADLYCEIELARSNCYYGAWALSNDEPELGIAACLSRVSASEAFDLAAREMIQLHGGVGYTWEYDCHLFYRRAKLLGLTLGASGLWGDRLVERMEG